MTTDASAAPANPGYLAFHRPRFEFVLRILKEHASGGNVRILDVGPSPLTDLIRTRLGMPIDTLGLEPESDAPHGHHYRFDLNDAQVAETPAPVAEAPAPVQEQQQMGAAPAEPAPVAAEPAPLVAKADRG